MKSWIWCISLLPLGGVLVFSEARAASFENEDVQYVQPRYGPKEEYHSKPLYGPDTGYHSLPAERVAPAYGEETGFHSPPAKLFALPQDRLVPALVRGPARIVGSDNAAITRAPGIMGPSLPVPPSQTITPGRLSRAYFPDRAEKPKREVPPKQLILRDFFSKAIRSKPGRRDQVEMARLTQVALERALSGMLLQWDNPKSGKKGTVIISKRFRDEAGILCSNLQQSVSFQGNIDIAYGMACLGKDGLWRVKK